MTAARAQTARERRDAVLACAEEVAIHERHRQWAFRRVVARGELREAQVADEAEQHARLGARGQPQRGFGGEAVRDRLVRQFRADQLRRERRERAREVRQEQDGAPRRERAGQFLRHGPCAILAVHPDAVDYLHAVWLARPEQPTQQAHVRLHSFVGQFATRVAAARRANDFRYSTCSTAIAFAGMVRTEPSR